MNNGRDINFLLRKYYNERGGERKARQEEWSQEHLKNHISEARIQQKMVEVQELGFRLRTTEKDKIKYIIRLLDNDFNRINRSLSNDQILVMIICFIRMETDLNNRGKYYKKLEEWNITVKEYNTFLIRLLMAYRS